MKIKFTEKEISLKEKEDGTYSFRMNGDILCEGFKTKEDALDRASQIAKILMRRTIKKTID